MLQKKEKNSWEKLLSVFKIFIRLCLFLSFVRVNLALAYTELTEELCRLRNLTSLQSQILRTLMQEQVMNGEWNLGIKE